MATITTTPASTIEPTISLTFTRQPYGDEWTVACGGCDYYRHHGSKRAADNDHITHEC